MPNLTGLMSAESSQTGTLSSDGTLTGTLNQTDGVLTGVLGSTSNNISGYLSNSTLRGVPVEIQISDNILQWKYQDEDEWRDLIDLKTIDYNELSNLPTINGSQVSGEISEYIITPSDELSNLEIAEILK